MATKFLSKQQLHIFSTTISTFSLVVFSALTLNGKWKCAGITSPKEDEELVIMVMIVHSEV